MFDIDKHGTGEREDLRAREDHMSQWLFAYRSWNMNWTETEHETVRLESWL
jgi:hypothetical protein